MLTINKLGAVRARGEVLLERVTALLAGRDGRLVDGWRRCCRCWVLIRHDADE